jgi:hypothetical protein
VLACLAGCATRPRSPFFGDEAYLRFGVDKRDEAAALIKLYAEQHEPVALRVVGHYFTGIGFMDRSGHVTRVRLVTARGIELALDPEPRSTLHAAQSYRLLAPPLDDTHDADGDGFEEVFIERRGALGTCLLVYRVRDVGFVDRVPTPARVFGQLWCPSGVEDLDQNGRAELLVVASLPGFDGEAPQVRVPLYASNHRFELGGDPKALLRYVAIERTARQVALAEAVAHNDVDGARRVAVELAALSHLRGDSAAEQVAAFDAALSGMAQTEEQQDSAKRARDRIYAEWNRAPQPAAAAAVSSETPTSATSNAAQTRPAGPELVHHGGP